MPKNDVSKEGNVEGGEVRKKGHPLNSESLIEDFDAEAMDKDAERDIPPDAQTGQPTPDLGEQHGELINDGEGENEKGKKPETDVEHPDLPKGALDEDESNIDPDIRRDVESGKENAA